MLYGDFFYLIFVFVYIVQREGIPNIIGEFYVSSAQGGSSAQKAFKVRGQSGNSITGIGSSWYNVTFDFDASKGETKADGTLKNDVYGKSDHLEPMNITVRLWKRVS